MKISKIPAQNFCITFISTYTVEPLKTDTPRDRPKCLSYRGVRLIEVLQSIDIRKKELKVQLIVVGQALMNIKMVS